MSPNVLKAFANILAKRLPSTVRGAVLEVGAGGPDLLALPVVASWCKVALNLRVSRAVWSGQQTLAVAGNSNALAFRDESFELVMSCSVLEHDARFWRSLGEIKRVLKPGGFFIVGVPIFMTLPTDCRRTTLTYARHGLAYNADFYRFSEQTVRDVFFDEYASITDLVLVRRYPNPYLVAMAKK